MCVHMCIMNLHMHGCVYIFLWFTCYFVLAMKVSCCLSTIFRFNKVYWLYLKSLPIWGFCTIIRLIYRTIFWLGLADRYMYVFMYLWKKPPHCVTLLVYVFGEKWLCHDSLIFYSFFQLPFWSDTLSSCIPFLVQRKMTSVKKPFVVSFGIK